jgi:hypothetical protein
MKKYRESNLVFLITIGALNWIMLYGFVRLPYAHCARQSRYRNW